MNCKACNETFEPKIKEQRFCSDTCTKDYDKVMGKARNNSLPKYRATQSKTNISIHLDVIKRNVVKYGSYTISNKTLEGYIALKEFDEFLLVNRFKLLNVDDDLSLVKRV
jgi:hypothetical protein